MVSCTIFYSSFAQLTFGFTEKPTKHMRQELSCKHENGNGSECS